MIENGVEYLRPIGTPMFREISVSQVWYFKRRIFLKISHEPLENSKE